MEMVRIAHPDVAKPASVPARVLAHYEAVGWRRVDEQPVADEQPIAVADLPPVPAPAPEQEPPAEPELPASDTPIGDAVAADTQTTEEP